MSERIPRLLAILLSTAVLFVLSCSSPAATPTPTVAPKSGAEPKATALPAKSPESKPAAPATTPAAAAPKALEKLKFTTSNITGVYGALWTTKEAKLFEKYGLDVELIMAAGSTSGNASLFAGDTPMIGVSGSSAINSILSGSDAVLVASIVDKMPYQVLTTKDITKAADLKGKKIGINKFGGTADFAARYWLKGQGMDPSKDAAILQVGGQTERFAALQNGAVQATLVDPPFNIAAEKQGFKVLVDLQDLNIPYASTNIVTTKSFLNSKPETVRNFLKAYVEGIAVYKSNPQVGVAALKKYLKIDDTALLEETRKYWADKTPKLPLVQPEGVRLILEEAATENPKAKDLEPEKVADMRMLKELGDSGFVDSVQKK